MISCDCSVDDYDSPACYRATHRKARKSHWCCECGGEIVRGQRYEYVSGVWDGNPSDFKTCLTCVEIRKHYCPGGWLHGELAQQIYDCLDFDYRYVQEEDEDEKMGGDMFVKDLETWLEANEMLLKVTCKKGRYQVDLSSFSGSVVLEVSSVSLEDAIVRLMVAWEQAEQ